MFLRFASISLEKSCQIILKRVVFSVSSIYPQYKLQLKLNFIEYILYFNCANFSTDLFVSCSNKNFKLVILNIFYV